MHKLVGKRGWVRVKQCRLDSVVGFKESVVSGEEEKRIRQREGGLIPFCLDCLPAGNL